MFLNNKLSVLIVIIWKGTLCLLNSDFHLIQKIHCYEIGNRRAHAYKHTVNGCELFFWNLKLSQKSI